MNQGWVPALRMILLLELVEKLLLSLRKTVLYGEEELTIGVAHFHQLK